MTPAPGSRGHAAHPRPTRLVILSALLLVVWVLLGCASARGAQAAPPATKPPVYTVAQVVRQPAHLARLLGGRLLVLGVIWGCDAGVAGTGTRCISTQPVLVDPRTGARMAVILDPPARGSPIQHIRWGRLATYRARLVARRTHGGYALALPDTDAALIYEQGHG